MNRFDKSMSWSTPKESGKIASDETLGETPDSSAHESCWNDQQGAGEPHCDDLLGSELGSNFAAARSFFLPLHYTPSYAYPLVVWLHSNRYNENQIDRVMPHVSLRNYVGVGIRGTRAADTRGHSFDWHDSPAAIASAHEAACDAIDEATRRFSVQPSRVVLAGYREGGTMAQRIAFRDPNRFAGVISLGGRVPHGGLGDLIQLRQRRLPMLWQWGRDNPEYNDTNLKADCQHAMTTGIDLEIRQYPDEDEMNTVTLRDVDGWIMRRIVANSSIADSDRWSSTPIAYSQN